jgi:hypothetical protein
VAREATVNNTITLVYRTLLFSMLEIIQAGSALVLRLSLRTFRKKRVEVNETVQWLEKVINSTLLETKFWKIIVSLDAMMHVKF